MICAIMQPTYLPWPGYFNIISKSDIFVFLDDAQFQKNSWHNRNRILVNEDVHWITVPVRHHSLQQKINKTEILNTQMWRKKHGRTLRQTYSKHPFFGDIMSIIELIEKGEFSNLSKLNMEIILLCLSKMNIKTEVYLSSDSNLGGERTDKLINILEFYGVQTYLSPEGALEYLEHDNFTKLTGVKLVTQSFFPSIYKQSGSINFHSYLSIVDVVANIGWKYARLYVDGDYVDGDYIT
jgi:hypothetical protein